MIDCPECNAYVDGLVCPKCLYRDPAAGPDPGPITPADPQRWLCCHVSRGLRCASLGTISPSTTGTGPWFCAHHMPGLAHLRTPRPPGFTYPQPVRTTYRQLDIEAELERLAIQTETRPPAPE